MHLDHSIYQVVVRVRSSHRATAAQREKLRQGGRHILQWLRGCPQQTMPRIENAASITARNPRRGFQTMTFHIRGRIPGTYLLNPYVTPCRAPGSPILQPQEQSSDGDSDAKTFGTSLTRPAYPLNYVQTTLVL